MRARVLGHATVMTVAAALFPLSPTVMSAQAAEATASAASRAGTTSVVVKAARCKDCRVVAVWTPRNEGIQSFYSADVVRSRAVLRVPTRQTRGLVFTVVNPRAKGRIHGLPLVAVQYKGMRTGSEVTPTRAAKARQAKVCWSGTTEKSVTLKLRTRRDSRLESIGGYRYWLGDTTAASGPWKYASRGSVAIRDGYDVCG